MRPEPALEHELTPVQQSHEAEETVTLGYLPRKTLNAQFSRDQQAVTSVDDIERAIGSSVCTDTIGAEKHVVDIGRSAQRLGVRPRVSFCEVFPRLSAGDTGTHRVVPRLDGPAVVRSIQTAFTESRLRTVIVQYRVLVQIGSAHVQVCESHACEGTSARPCGASAARSSFTEARSAGPVISERHAHRRKLGPRICDLPGRRCRVRSAELRNAGRNIVDSDARTFCLLVGIFGTDMSGLELTALLIVRSRQKSLYHGNFIRTLLNDAIHFILCVTCCGLRECEEAGDIR